jgi:chloramphenicol-sensitive protein RarD
MKARSASSIGTLVAFATYGMWGLFPLYWKQLKSVDPVQIICHRIVWAMVFALLLLAATRKLGTLAAITKDRKRAPAMVASGFFITANWGIYIVAINGGRIMESALGYYITPLLSVALGAIVFKERLDRWTAIAVGVAAAGVAAASIMLGTLPWISLALAATFALYGAVKKKVGLGPVEGLAAETLAMSPFALAWLVAEGLAGRGALGGPDLKVNAMLVLAGVVTAVPLLCFAFAANRITLQRMGFIQYVSPSLQLTLGILVYGERLTPPLAVAFATVIAAVLIYALTRRGATPGA